MAALGAGHVDDANLALQQFRIGGLPHVRVDAGAVGRRQYLGEVVDLDYSVGADAVRHIQPVDGLPFESAHHDRTMHAGRHDLAGRLSSRHEEGRAGILTRIAEVHDVFRSRRIAEIEYLEVLIRAAIRAPAVEGRVLRVGGAPDDVCDTRLAVPPIAVGDIQTGYRCRHQHRIGRLGDIPDLVGYRAVLTQHIRVIGYPVRQIVAAAQLHHARTALIG